MDLVEKKDHFLLSADLPGLGEDDVHVELDDNVLTISGERQSEQEDRTEGSYRIERASGYFSRSLTLPEGIDPDSIDARFEKGVLEVKIPKPAERKPRRVAINVGKKASSLIEGARSKGSESKRAGSPGSSSQGAGPDSPRSSDRARGERPGEKATA